MRTCVALVVVLALILLGLGSQSAQADPRMPLGPLDLTGYCMSLGYTGATLKGPIIGHQAAYNNWRCFSGTPTPGNLHPFSMEQACMWQYNQNAVQAHPLDPDNAFTWVCYSTAHTE